MLRISNIRGGAHIRIVPTLRTSTPAPELLVNDKSHERKSACQQHICTFRLRVDPSLFSYRQPCCKNTTLDLLLPL